MKLKKPEGLIRPDNTCVPLSRKEKLLGLVTYIFRLAVGLVFIYSGYVKAIDPWGTLYKLREYVSVMHVSSLYSLLTVGTFMLFTVEFLIGVALVTGSYRRCAPRFAMLMMAFMLPLTLWIAIYNPVADCGCFGEALLLSNWATFWKNVVLVVMIAWLMKYNATIRCIIIPTVQVWSLSLSAAFVILLGFIGYNFQPLVDYRPYPAGGSLMAIDQEEDAASGYRSVWSDGTNEITIPADSIPEGDAWEFVDRIAVSGAGESHKDKGLAIYEDGEDVMEDVLLQDGKQVIVFFPSIREVSIANYYKLNSLYAFAQGHDVDMLAVASGDSLQIATFRDLSLAEYPIFTAEDTAIKEVVRGNPAVVYLEDGDIIWKSSLAALPTDDFMDGNTKDLSQFKTEDSLLLRNLWAAYISLMGMLILLSHVPMFFRTLRRKIRKPFVGLFALAIFPCLSSCSEADEPSVSLSDDCTVIIYMVATNSLDSSYLIDIEEIKKAVEKMPADKINVLVYSVVYGNAPQLYHVRNNGALPATMVSLCTYPDDGMSLTPERMRQVVDDAMAQAPADSYGIFFWSHALNWLPANKANDIPRPSYCFGDDSGRAIDITDMADALPDEVFDFIWMDCCLMGSVEAAYQFRNKCDYYVGYPTEVLADGLPYDDVLPALCHSGVAALPEAARLTYESYMSQPSDYMRSCTVSVIDTDALPDMAGVCHDIVEANGYAVSLIGLQSYGRKEGVSFYDAAQSFGRMCGNVSPLKASLDAAFRNAVIYKAATPEFLGNVIAPEHFSGLSASLLQTITKPNLINLYHELDWYKAVYIK